MGEVVQGKDQDFNKTGHFPYKGLYFPARHNFLFQATRKVSLAALPPFLILHMKRFQFNPRTLEVKKIDRKVTVKERITIEPYLQSPALRVLLVSFSLIIFIDLKKRSFSGTDTRRRGLRATRDGAAPRHLGRGRPLHGGGKARHEVVPHRRQPRLGDEAQRSAARGQQTHPLFIAVGSPVPRWLVNY